MRTNLTALAAMAFQGRAPRLEQNQPPIIPSDPAHGHIPYTGDWQLNFSGFRQEQEDATQLWDRSDKKYMHDHCRQSRRGRTGRPVTGIRIGGVRLCQLQRFRLRKRKWSCGLFPLRISRWRRRFHKDAAPTFHLATYRHNGHSRNPIYQQRAPS